MAIRCLVLDVDGVLTDGRFYYADDGRVLRAFHVQDGIAIEWFQRLGGIVAILSGKSSPAVAARAADLRIRHVIQGSQDKLADLRKLLDTLDVSLQETAFMGDDLPDIAPLRACAVAIAPRNAVHEVRAVAEFITEQSGGNGAVREAIELIIKRNDRWAEIRALFHLDSGAGAIR
jgi:3-deoxy-D-manno-octulosonate 8-phosphate phosphatase (KDO 8-P phosphatase)